MTNGVIYVAVGEKYVAEALASAASLKAHSPALPVSVFTDQTLTSPLLEQIIPLDPSAYHPTFKPRCLMASPYDRTLFMDTDTYVCADISGMFALLERFDLAATHANFAIPGSARALLPDVVTRVPEAFVQFNSGVILFRRSTAMTDMCRRWVQLIEINEGVARDRGGKHLRDQTALREAVYESDLRIATLPREYNCRYHFVGALFSDIKILHGRWDDMSKVRSQLNLSSEPRVFMNYRDGMQVVTRSELKHGFRRASFSQRAAMHLQKGGLPGLAAAMGRHFVRLGREMFKQAPVMSTRTQSRAEANANAALRADIMFVSFPKCGRTWLRVLLGHALQLHFHKPELDYWQQMFGGDAPGLPCLSFRHDGGPLTQTAAELPADKTLYRDKKVVVLVRDPRDALVSAYFQTSQRKYGQEPKRRFQGTLHEYLHQPVGSVDTFLRYYAIWAEQRHIPRDFLLLRYEDMHADPVKELRRVLDFIGVTGVSEEVIAEAVAFASFENMHRMEMTGEASSAKLQPSDVDNPDSLKTRRGIVGGYVDYLSADDIEYLNKRIRAEFPPYYGYSI